MNDNSRKFVMSTIQDKEMCLLEYNSNGAAKWVTTTTHNFTIQTQIYISKQCLTEYNRTQQRQLHGIVHENTLER